MGIGLLNNGLQRYAFFLNYKKKNYPELKLLNRGMNRGLIPFVIVIVIECHFLPLFFLKSGTLIFDFLGIII